MKSRKKLITYLVAPLILLWGIVIVFAINLYEFGNEYPAELVGPDRMQDAMNGIYVIMGVAAVMSVVWICVWSVFRKNQITFDSSLTEQEKATEHSWLDTSLPLSLRGDKLRINRGFFISSIDINEITRIHLYIWPFGKFRSLRPLAVTFHKLNGKKKTLLFERGNASGVKAILGKVQQANLSIAILDETNI